MPEPTLRHYRWDVDKTYIHTEFDTTRDLIRAWRQRPEDKRNIPGAPALLRELLHDEPDHRRVTFISGSPRQMEKVLRQKFALDGIEPDAFILKPNLQNVLTLRLRAVRSQVGYKLGALLDSREPNAAEFLFGDDSEQDAFIYSLYADMLTQDVGVDELQEILTACALYQGEVERLVARYLAATPDRGRVQRVFIHLDRRSPVSRFIPYGPRVVPVYNYFQAALVLFDMRVLDDRALVRMLEAMHAEGYTATRLANSLQDLVRRGYLKLTATRKVRDALKVHASATGPGRATTIVDELQDVLRTLKRPAERTALVDERPDYLSLIERHRYRRPTDAATGRQWLQDP